MRAVQLQPCWTGFAKKEILHTLIKISIMLIEHLRDYRFNRLWSSAHPGHGQVASAHCWPCPPGRNAVRAPRPDQGLAHSRTTPSSGMGRPNGGGEQERSTGRRSRCHLETGRGFPGS